jgi:uncharacterized protein YceK
MKSGRRSWFQIGAGLTLFFSTAVLSGCASVKQQTSFLVGGWYCAVDATKNPDKCYKNDWCTCPPGSQP